MVQDVGHPLTSEMNKEEIMQKASQWMLARGWKRKIAKRRQFDQSLFEHTLVELDVALQLMPILRQPSHFNLSLDEEKVLIVSLVGHDIGKERDEWQEYILGKRGFVSDVEPKLTECVLPELCSALGFNGIDHKVRVVISNCIDLHMSHERHDSNVVVAVLRGTDRWYTLANLVYHIDNVCSAKGVFQAQEALQRSLLGKHLKVARHQITIRGVSSTALHRAALECFEEMGWIPLLHFGDASLYVCSAAQEVSEPSPVQIGVRLAEVLRDVTGKDVTQFIVGSPTGNILPKPELFDHSEIRSYLEVAARKIRPNSFAISYEREKKRAAKGMTVRAGRGKSKAEVIQSYWALRNVSGELYSVEMDRDAERISSAQPDMVVFKFFKAAMKLVGSQGAQVVQKEYEAVFGSGSWRDLYKTSTLMPAQDMALTVDRFWRLPGARFGLSVDTLEELAPDKRTELLVDTLAGIAQRVYAAVENPPTRATLAREMADHFVRDLVTPTARVDFVELARQQMEFYAFSKPFAGKQTGKARYVCPICNTPFKEGTKAAADFIDSPESHTNRAVAHGFFGYITICDTCKYERILRQMLLGERAAELIVMFPRMNVGPAAGDLLVRKARALYDRAYSFMVGDTEDPDRRLWLSFTAFIAGQVLGEDIHQLTPEQMVDLLVFRSGDEIRRNNRRQLEKELKAAYEEDLEAANNDWGTDFASWDDAANAVYANQVADPEARRIRAQIYKLYPQMQLVCQTPHMILIPVSYAIKMEDESETNAALRRTFVALLLGLSLDVSVAIVRDSDQIDFQGGEGVAWVPPVAGARDLIGSDWVPLESAERWFQRIGLASILASAGQYSKRSGLFEVLTAPTAGHILRRIEQKRAADRTPLGYEVIAHLRRFEEVMQT